MQDELSTTIYFTLQSQCNNTLQSAPQLTAVNITGLSPIVNDLGNYNLYLTSLNMTTTDLPYFNARKYIINYDWNKMNLSVSMLCGDPTKRFFTVDGSVSSAILKGIGNNTGNTWQGVCCFLQYNSENANPSVYPNPTASLDGNTESYPDTYFDVHSIQQFLDFINEAFALILNANTNITDSNKIMYLSYDANSQLYTFNIHNNIVTALTEGTYGLYVNEFLERFLDAFRWQFLSHTDLTLFNYTGMNYQFIPSISNLSLLNATSQVWGFPCEYPIIINLIDTHAVIIKCAGSFNQVSQEYTPTTAGYSRGQLPSQAVLKNFDVLFSGNVSTVNNSIITFNVSTLDRPINIPQGVTKLSDLVFTFYRQDIQNNEIQIMQPSVSSSNIKFCLRKKKNIV